MTCTGGRVLFASGSPFPPFTYKGKEYTPGQGNNMYVFPGIGLGAILSKAVNVTQEMIYASADSLSKALNGAERRDCWLYPEVSRIREVSVEVARGVIRAAQESKVDRELSLRNLSDERLTEDVRSHEGDGGYGAGAGGPYAWAEAAVSCPSVDWLDDEWICSI